MKGFVQNIEGLAVKNDKFRQVLYTAKNSQLVLMSLKPQEDTRFECNFECKPVSRSLRSSAAARDSAKFS